MGVEKQEIEADREVGMARGEGLGLPGKALFLLQGERQVGTGSAAAGFDFDQGEGAAFAQEEIGLGEGAQGARGRAVAPREQVEKGNDFSAFAFELGGNIAPSLQQGTPALGKPGRGR